MDIADILSFDNITLSGILSQAPASFTLYVLSRDSKDLEDLKIDPELLPESRKKILISSITGSPTLNTFEDLISELLESLLSEVTYPIALELLSTYSDVSNLPQDIRNNFRVYFDLMQRQGDEEIPHEYQELNAALNWGVSSGAYFLMNDRKNIDYVLRNMTANFINRNEESFLFPVTDEVFDVIAQIFSEEDNQEIRENIFNVLKHGMGFSEAYEIVERMQQIDPETAQRLLG